MSRRLSRLVEGVSLMGAVGLVAHAAALAEQDPRTPEEKEADRARMYARMAAHQELVKAGKATGYITPGYDPAAHKAVPYRNEGRAHPKGMSKKDRRRQRRERP